MNLLKQTAVSLIEKGMAKNARVLDTRCWSPDTLLEIDLHLPGVAMAKWSSIQHIKIKVAPFTYRDYTPAFWDAATETCTLIVDTGHEGAGSTWARNLSPGDSITYLGIGSTQHKPIQTGNRMVCLGDTSAIAHFMALQQLAGNDAPVTGLVWLNEKDHPEQFSQYFRTAIQPVFTHEADLERQMAWLEEHIISNDTVYIAGHMPKVVKLRKFIRNRKAFSGSIKSHGFWA